MTTTEYINQCIKNCGCRISDPEFFSRDRLQANALRVEGLRDLSPRCGEKPPEHWHDDAKERGWAMWCYSGGCASVFGHCNSDCPRMQFFARHAPTAKLRRDLLREVA